MTVCRWVVRGMVQGVGFRWFVSREAERLQLGGFVRNLPDGTVEVVSQGDEKALEVLEQALRRGPRGARVEAVERLHVPGELEIPTWFDIR
ncbi:MAG: acylphosphatase [Gemmatimonadales bacterium]